ncbi:MAG: class I SAM-dependent methyltransferase [Candidatus Latescibacteria bacterium]|nr:class I SAM-dependent methyltransferase [Candidatus Latescibacterota bacterium]
MATQVKDSEDLAARLCLSLLQELLSGYTPGDFAVRLWEGTRWAPEPLQPSRCTLLLSHPGALRRMLATPNQLNLAEAYVYGDFDVEGDLEALVAMGDHLRSQSHTLWEKLNLARALRSLPDSGPQRRGRQAARLRGEKHSLDRDRQAIAYHYNVSNDFYALFLDRRMVYSCAYFADPEEELDLAQERKLDYVCRKLRLRPGDRLLDIGCGWGGLMLHAAQHYGAEVVGVTLSQPQAELASQRLRQAGLADRCRVDLLDYRQLDPAERFDKLVSIGMVEHVGADHLPEYFRKAWELLRPGGVFLNHGIADHASRPPAEARGYLNTYVFPDGELPPLHAVLRAAEEARFEVRDAESLREHYALTLRHWVRRLEACHQEALRHVDEATYRIWRLYMAGSANWFARGYLGVFQALLVKPDRGISGLPLTRGDWYK